MQLRAYLVDPGPAELRVVREARERLVGAAHATTQILSGTTVPGMLERLTGGRVDIDVNQSATEVEAATRAWLATTRR